MTERQNGVTFAKKVGIVASAIIGVGGILGFIGSVSYRWAVSPSVEAIQAEAKARIAADADLHTQQLRLQGYIWLNTRRLDAIAVVLTAPAGSRLYRDADQELMELRKERAGLGGLGGGP